MRPSAADASTYLLHTRRESWSSRSRVETQHLLNDPSLAVTTCAWGFDPSLGSSALAGLVWRSAGWNSSSKCTVNQIREQPRRYQCWLSHDRSERRTHVRDMEITSGVFVKYQASGDTCERNSSREICLTHLKSGWNCKTSLSSLLYVIIP